jgi:thioredoxin-related protein
VKYCRYRMKKDFQHLLILSFFSIFLLITPKTNAQVTTDTVVYWKTMEEVIELRSKDPKPTMVFFNMPGKDTCELMLENIFTKREICTYLKPRFYPVIVNVTDSAIQWFNGKTYYRKPGEVVNSIVNEVLGKNPVYPSLLFFNKENSGIAMKGYKSRYEMRSILVYFAEEINRTTPFHLWHQSYQVAYPMINMPKMLDNPIKWHTLSEALELQKKEPKLLFINWYARLNVGSQVMLFNAFENPTVAEYLNKNFYCVRLDAQTKDTLVWDKSYVNLMKPDKFHELARTQLGDSYKFPSFLFYDQNKKELFKQQSYLGPLNFYALVNYIGSGAYKTKKLTEFIKTFKADI